MDRRVRSQGIHDLKYSATLILHWIGRRDQVAYELDKILNLEYNPHLRETKG